MICCGLDIEYWPHVKDAIQEALNHDDGRVTAQDLYEDILEKNVQLWALHDGVIRAVMTTRIINYPQLRAIRIITVTGADRDEWLDLLIDTIGRWGAENGAHVIEFCGRKGWEKVLTKKGFEHPQIFMTKEIN